MQDRIEALRARYDEWNAGALLITNLTNVRYLTGFTGSAGTALLTRERAVFFSDGRYQEQSAREIADWEIDIGQGTRTLARVADVVEALGLHRVGFEAETMTVAQYEDLAETLKGRELVAVHGALETLRECKCDAEIAALRRAAAINDRVVEVACAAMREGLTEKQLARTIRDAIEALGGEGLAFDTIVLFGARSSLPHGQPGETVLRYGDIVLMDFGARVDGYHGDITRTVAFGEAPPHFVERYNAVLAAQQAVTGTLRPGMTGEQADAIARERLEAAGYKDAFMHGTGHGVGLEIHEAPRLAQTADNELKAGHVLTNEPGIYLEGWGGIRIEDMLLLTSDGAQRLTQSPLELRIV